jgi:hypothetical protein
MTPTPGETRLATPYAKRLAHIEYPPRIGNAIALHQVSGTALDAPFVIESNAFMSGEFFPARKVKTYT